MEALLLGTIVWLDQTLDSSCCPARPEEKSHVVADAASYGAPRVCGARDALQWQDACQT